MADNGDAGDGLIGVHAHHHHDGALGAGGGDLHHIAGLGAAVGHGVQLQNLAALGGGGGDHIIGHFHLVAELAALGGNGAHGDAGVLSVDSGDLVLGDAVDNAQQGGKLMEMYPVTNGGAEAGYVLKISASGSQGSIVMMVGVDANKAITGISVVSHAETSGIGTKVVGNDLNAAGEPVLDQFIGLSGAGSLVVGSNITPITGATVSTKGITTGANAALAAVDALG